jgi:hypothetical protein
VNYLSHYRLNHLTGEPRAADPWFVAGVMIPDLWPRYARVAGSPGFGTRIDPATLAAASPVSDDAQALRDGLLNHNAADAAFHECAAFRRWTAAVAPHARRLTARRSVSGFLSHIAVELALDGLIVAADPEIGSGFYDALDAIDPARLGAALSEVVGPHAAAFGPLFADFRSRRHLLGYATPENVAASLSRIVRLVPRAGDPPPAVGLTGLVRHTAAVLANGDDDPLAISTWLTENVA